MRSRRSRTRSASFSRRPRTSSSRSAVGSIQVVEQIRARRGASIAIAKDSTLANDSAIDVTTEVLAALNQALPSVSVTPLPQQQQQQQPQGR